MSFFGTGNNAKPGLEFVNSWFFFFLHQEYSNTIFLVQTCYKPESKIKACWIFFTRALASARQ